jgi:hypothetical protein
MRSRMSLTRQTTIWRAVRGSSSTMERDEPDDETLADLKKLRERLERCIAMVDAEVARRQWRYSRVLRLKCDLVAKFPSRRRAPRE